MTEELEKEAKEYTKNLLKKLGIKEDMLLENQPKYLRQESMNFVALDVENVTDAYLAGAEFGYNKAKEWHFVKDGYLPKNNTQTLVLLENKRMKISIFMENKFTVWNKEYNTYTKLYNVIAWKEIVLPKESE